MGGWFGRGWFRFGRRDSRGEVDSGWKSGGGRRSGFGGRRELDPGSLMEGVFVGKVGILTLLSRL